MIGKKESEQKKIHIVALALLQLLLFTFPLVVKTSHHHSNAHHIQNGIELSQWEKPCAVCHFEFETALKTEHTVFCCSVPASIQIIAEYATPIHSCAFSYISLRAPPLS